MNRTPTLSMLLLAALLLTPTAWADQHLPRVENVRLQEENQLLVITWDLSQSPDVAGYVVRIWRDGDLVQQINKTEPAASFRGVNQLAYSVEVSAVDADGQEGPPSNPVAGVPRLENDQRYLALGLIAVWLGIWIYAAILTRVEQRLRRDIDAERNQHPQP